MKKIQVSQKTYDNAKLLIAFNIGLSVGSGLGWYLLEKQERKLNKKVKARHSLLSRTVEDLFNLQRDVTLSGEEREKKSFELIEFLKMVAKEDLY